MLIVENREKTKNLTKAEFFYSPALRFKKGEYQALSKLPPNIADKIKPRLVLPPPKEERDVETGLFFNTPEQCVHKTAERIGRYWPNKIAFVEPRFLIEAFGEKDILSWLPKIFEVARSYSGRPVPLASLDDLKGKRLEAFKQSIRYSDSTRIAIRILSSEVDDDLKKYLLSALKHLNITPDECALFLDFSDADLSDTSAIADFATMALENLQEIGLWQSIIFQATNYPETNPANSGSHILVQRAEWKAWRQAIQIDENAAKNLIFGDYAADSAKFKFAGGGGRPIPHYRYCVNGNWFVVRGRIDQKQTEAIREVCRAIIKSTHFSGRSFCEADNYIYETAKSINGGGTASDWREMNTLRHICLVVSDLSKIYDFEIERAPIANEMEQIGIFDTL